MVWNLEHASNGEIHFRSEVWCWLGYGMVWNPLYKWWVLVHYRGYKPFSVHPERVVPTLCAWPEELSTNTSIVAAGVIRK